MELGATDAEAGRKTGAEVGLGVLAAETGAAEEMEGGNHRRKLVLPHAELLGGQMHTVYCSLCLLFHGGVGLEQLEEGWEGGQHLGGQGGQ